jgi:hypothetical protein
MGGIAQTLAAELGATAPIADKLLFVITATGGGSLVDSFMAVRESECSTPDMASQLIVYPDAYVASLPDTEIRAVNPPFGWSRYLGAFPGNGYSQLDFVTKHAQDMAVMTLMNSSVNHLVAQQRALNGNGVNGGRTIGEHVAQKYGQSQLLPFVNMSTGGYLQAGTDLSLAEFAQAEIVGQPHLFALGTDGMRGMVGAPGGEALKAPALGAELERGRAILARARAAREQLEGASLFGQTFQCSELRNRLLELQAKAPSVEAQDLVSNLLMFTQEDIDLATYGLAGSSAAQQARAVLQKLPKEVPGYPPIHPLTDPLMAQTCLAYLLTRFGYSSSVTLGPTFSPNPNVLHVEPPIAFDYSHNDHVAAQGAMWGRVLDYTDKLITLLKATPVGASGGTMWDRSLIYIATDFGRDKIRVYPGQPLATTEGIAPINTGHHLNNGAVLLSPMLKGGVYGGVDPDTLLTYGFDRQTGAKAPGTQMSIGDIYSAIGQTLDAPFSSMIDLPAVKV